MEEDNKQNQHAGARHLGKKHKKMKTRVHHNYPARIVGLTTVGPLLASLGLLAILTPDAAAAPPGYTFTPIAFLGDPAPGGGVFVNDFEPGRINDRGEVTFTADLDVSGQGGEGLFLVGNGAIKQIARFGQPAPGGGTFSAGVPGITGLNEDGDVAFGFTLEPLQYPLPLNAGLYRYSHSKNRVSLVAGPGTPIPAGGSFVGAGLDAVMNNQGIIAFTGFDSRVDVTDPYSWLGVFVADRQNRITSVANPADGVFRCESGTGGTPSINNQGDVAWASWRAGEPSYSVFLKPAQSDSIATLVQQGDVSDQGDVLHYAVQPRINDRGDVAFLGMATPRDGRVPWWLEGIFVYSRGLVRRLALEQDVMPGGGRVGLIPGSSWQVGFNSRGDVAFAAPLDTGEEGLYVYVGGSLRLVARTGTVIPGVGTILNLETWRGAQLNNHGQIPFACTLTDGRIVLLLATPHGAN